MQNSNNNKLPSNKNVLVLGKSENCRNLNHGNDVSNSATFCIGDNESGKTTLIAKLQGVEDPKKGSGLEYAYIDVRDEYRDG